jgi:hypothetical protein
VHTIFAGEGAPEAETPGEDKGLSENTNSSGPDTQEERTTRATGLAVHHATCDLCDSAIKGDRFVSHLCCTVRYSYTVRRNASSAQISIHARHAMRSYPHNTHVTALLAYVIRRT